MSEQSYPVLIECTEHRLVWVEAESAEDAAAIVNEDSEWIASSEVYDTDWKASTPTEWGWQDLYGYGGSAPINEAHVVAHLAEIQRQKRAAKIAECAAAGHPGRETYADGPIWCKACFSYLGPEAGR